jgi:hypothetical protein
MWQPLQSVNQLAEGSRIRQVILDGNFQHESIHLVERIGEFYFTARYNEQNGQELPEDKRTVTPYRTQGLMHYGFEIWTD